MKLTPMCATLAAIAVALCVFQAEALPAAHGAAHMLSDLEMPDAEMGNAIIAINSEIEKESKMAEDEVGDDSDLSMDQEIEMAGNMRVTKPIAPAHPDLGESASAQAGSTLQAMSKAQQQAFVRKQLEKAQAAIEKLKAGNPAEEAEFRKADKKAKAKVAKKEKVNDDSIGEDDEDVVDEPVDQVDAMKAMIEKQVESDVKASQKAQPEDPLSAEIDKIATVRKTAIARLHQKKKLRAQVFSELADARRVLALKAESLIEEGESTPALPPQAQAPPGPPLPDVASVKKIVQKEKPLARATPAIGNGVDPAPSQVNSALTALGVAPPDPNAGVEPIPEDPDFTEEEIAAEIKKHENYPMTHAELKTEIQRVLGTLPTPPTEEPMTIVNVQNATQNADAAASNTTNTATAAAPLPASVDVTLWQ